MGRFDFDLIKIAAPFAFLDALAMMLMVSSKRKRR
jgi:hypothetical protein